MPQQRRFEGSTLAEVLAKVQKEIGTHAKIESAQKVRGGGVGGFFQKERFEVIVNLDESVANHADHAAKPSSLLELAEQMNEVETGSGAPASAAKPEPAPTKAKAKPEADTRAEPGAQQAPKAQPIKAERPETTVSTESDAFAEVLSRVAFQAHMTSETEPRPASSPALPPREPAAEAPPPSAPAPAPAPLKAITSAIEPASGIPGRPAVLDTSVQKALVPEKAISPVRTRITDSPLAKLGLPAEYIPEVENKSELARILEDALERLPEPPIIRPSKGSIVAVVGTRREALKKAAALAEHWGRPKEEIVLATQADIESQTATILHSVQNAEDSRRSWRRRNQPTVVAIDAPPGSRSETKWAEHMLTAMEPIATYGVIDATRKAEDIAAWTQQLGGIDCLSINNIESTVSPASAISVGVPIDRIDGRDATPAYWAMLLTDRLGAA